MSETVYFLTGCAGGIGGEVAQGLLAGPGRFVLTDRKVRDVRTRLGLPARGRDPRMLLIDLDVTSRRDWQRVFRAAIKAFGRVDVLMNIAGVLKPGYIHEQDPRDIDLHVDVNIKGVMLGTHFAAAHMQPRGSGHIVNIASLAGLSPVPGLNLYSGTKFAVRGFSLSAHEELAPFGVAVTTVCPGAVRTPMLDLQEARPEAALTFSGPILSREAIAQAILGSLGSRPRELTVPAGFGLTARIVGAFPGLGGLFKNALLRKGLRKQRALRDARAP